MWQTAVCIGLKSIIFLRTFFFLGGGHFYDFIDSWQLRDDVLCEALHDLGFEKCSINYYNYHNYKTHLAVEPAIIPICEKSSTPCSCIFTITAYLPLPVLFAAWFKNNNGNILEWWVLTLIQNQNLLTRIPRAWKKNKRKYCNVLMFTAEKDQST